MIKIRLVDKSGDYMLKMVNKEVINYGIVQYKEKFYAFSGLLNDAAQFDEQEVWVVKR